MSGCRIDINRCHREDQWARDALDGVVAQNGGKKLGNAVTPNGPGHQEAKRAAHATEAGPRVA
jgi:hypothetical protein